MPAPTSVADLLDVLERSQLLKPSLVSQVRSQADSISDGQPTPELLAKSLVKSQLLTLYQVQRLLNGMADGFYLGKYKLLELLGRGGMGKVYLAEQITMGRLVAIKIISRFAKNRDDTLARFAREARAVAALQHPNIIQAFDFDSIDGLPYIVMEFVEGIDLGELTSQTGRIDWAAAADFGMQAALGLEAARKAGFVHRDIKPGNLLVDPSGHLKILDLGLAVSSDERNNDSLTSTNDQVGTVDFMSPEQAIDSHNVDCRTDIYSLGGVLYFVLTGELPCQGKNSAAKLVAHQQTPPRPIQELVPDIPADFAASIHRMLAKKPSERPQTPAEVAELLMPFTKRRSPSFDIKLLKYTRAALTPLLGRSPDLETINIAGQTAAITSPVRGKGGSSTSRVTGNSGNSGTTSSNTRRSKPTGTPSTQVSARNSSSTVSDMPVTKPGPATAASAAPPNALALRQPSAVTSDSPAVIGQASQKLAKTTVKKKSPKSTIVVIPDSPSATDDDDFLDALAEAPIIRPTKRLGKKKRKSARLRTPLLIGGSTLLALFVGYLLWTWMPSGLDLSAANLSGELPAPSYRNWRSWSNRFKEDSDLVFYFTFSGDDDTDDVIHSQATRPKFTSVTARNYGAKRTEGRFPEKKSLKFGGNAAKNYVALGDSDSNLCNFLTSFSVGVWFKAGPEKLNFQNVVSKGDNAWRLQRHKTDDKLQLGTNNTFQDPSTKQTKGKLTFTNSLTSMDDQKWHFAVAVYDLSGKKGVQQLYVDGRVEGVAEFEKLNRNDFPVYIGANSQTFKYDARAWTGWIDEVFVLNRALSADDVLRMYAAGRSPQ